jgi:hypothetical protein
VIVRDDFGVAVPRTPKRSSSCPQYIHSRAGNSSVEGQYVELRTDTGTPGQQFPMSVRCLTRRHGTQRILYLCAGWSLSVF